MGKGKGDNQRMQWELPPISDQAILVKRPSDFGPHLEYSQELYNWIKTFKAAAIVDPKISFKESNIRVKYRFFKKIPCIVVPRIETEMDYFAAMHELGHVANGDLKEWNSMREVLPKLLSIEARAWSWAIRNRTLEITPEVKNSIRAALRTYFFSIKGLASSQGLGYQICLPEEGHDFWELSETSPEQLEPSYKPSLEEQRARFRSSGFYLPGD